MVYHDYDTIIWQCEKCGCYYEDGDIDTDIYGDRICRGCRSPLVEVERKDYAEDVCAKLQIDEIVDLLNDEH